MKIYLAARYGRREELCAYRAQLQAAGYTVTSRWLNGLREGNGITDDGVTLRATLEESQGFAQEDKTDVRSAALVIAFTEEPDSPASRGGRHVEAGMALAWGIPLWIVGPRENVFYTLRQVTAYATWDEALCALKEPQP